MSMARVLAACAPSAPWPSPPPAGPRAQRGVVGAVAAAVGGEEAAAQDQASSPDSRPSYSLRAGARRAARWSPYSRGRCDIGSLSLRIGTSADAYGILTLEPELLRAERMPGWPGAGTALRAGACKARRRRRWGCRRARACRRRRPRRWGVTAEASDIGAGAAVGVCGRPCVANNAASVSARSRRVLALLIGAGRRTRTPHRTAPEHGALARRPLESMLAPVHAGAACAHARPPRAGAGADQLERCRQRPRAAPPPPLAMSAAAPCASARATDHRRRSSASAAFARRAPRRR